MYEELIKALEPKPKFNLQWYKGEDLYSEGQIEDVIIALIAQNEPEKYVDAIYDHFNWSTYYHLCHIRKNILNWYPFRKDADVLEIGCGMGAITGVLCDNCRSVTAVELSQKRATATLLRCREKSNLEIIVGNLNDICFEKKFDYITLIGVLEYQGSYTDTENPYLDFLKKVKSLLKPDGKLLIAIENQYGLKYWCGAREDHTSVPFDGMNQYTMTDMKVRTFSKQALENLIKDSGFQNTYFYYPMPDYKLPTVVYSQGHLPKNGNMENVSCYYVPDKKTLVAQEEHLYDDIIANGVFEFFANSFLVECSDCDEVGEVVFAKLSNERMPEYRIGTRFHKNAKVEKFSLSGKEGERHLLQILENEDKLAANGLHVWKSSFDGESLFTDYSAEDLAEDVLLQAYREGNQSEIYQFFSRYYHEILMSSVEVPWDENILYTFELGITPDQEKYGPILETGYLDMIFRNAFYIEGEMYWFDQEWILENVPAGFVFFRAIKEFYYAYPEANQVLAMEEVAAHFGMADAWADFVKMESVFQDVVMDKKHAEESGVYRRSGRAECIANIHKILRG